MLNDVNYKIVPTAELVIGGAYSALYDYDRYRMIRFESAFVPIVEAMKEDGLSLSFFKSYEPSILSKIEVFMKRLWKEDVLYSDHNLLRPPFSTISDGWDSPSEIINCIVDVSEELPNWDTLIEQLKELSCEALQVRSYSDQIGIEEAEEILRKLEGTCISHIELMVKATIQNNFTNYKKFLDKYPALVFVMIHSAQSNAHSEIVLDGTPIRRLLISQVQPLKSENQCGVINMDMLNQPSVKSCSELKNFQGCLNRKVSLRSDGQICNCPSLKKSYGTDLSKLAGIVRSKNFQKTWAINNDLVEVCKTCEFRYVCTGCRAYLETDMSLRKPLKCSYDPAIGVWNDENVE